MMTRTLFLERENNQMPKHENVSKMKKLFTIIIKIFVVINNGEMSSLLDS